MKPYYKDETCTIYHGDCREMEFEGSGVVLTDPPYGISYDASISSQKGISGHAPIKGDTELFNPTPWMKFRDVMLWGCNNYCHAIPPRVGQWYFWDKVVKNGLKVRIAECEYMWHKKGTKPRGFRHTWSGWYRASEQGKKSLHPNQKPVALLAWCLGLLDDGVVVDPYMGSGSCLVAAKRNGRTAIGVEIEERYCEIAANRLRQKVLF